MTEHGPHQDEAERVRMQAEKLQNVVEKGLVEHWEAAALLAELKKGGANSTEARDYFEQFHQRSQEALVNQNPTTAAAGGEAGELGREGTPEGLNDAERDDFRRRRDKLLVAAEEERSQAHRDAVEAAAWKVLEAKAQRVGTSRPTGEETIAISELIKLYGGTSPAAGVSRYTIPSSLFDVAPHLRDLSANAIRDPHLEATWKLRNAYAGKDVSDPLIDLLQSQPLAQPLPRSIWKTISQDQYVDFEKLFASMEPGYDHSDDLKDFGDGYALVKKDQASARKPLRTEADWIRVFGAWKTAIILLYPHRQFELEGYEKMVCNVFRASPHN